MNAEVCESFANVFIIMFLMKEFFLKSISTVAEKNTSGKPEFLRVRSLDDFYSYVSE